jgi:putative transposase
MQGFKLLRSAANALAGIELMHMMREAEFANDGAVVRSSADQFYAPAAEVRLA